MITPKDQTTKQDEKDSNSFITDHWSFIIESHRGTDTRLS